MAAAQAANHGEESGLTWYLWWEMILYINSYLNPLTKFTSAAVEALPVISYKKLPVSSYYLFYLSDCPTGLEPTTT